MLCQHGQEHMMVDPFSSSSSTIMLLSTSNGIKALPKAGTRFLWKAKPVKQYVSLMIVPKCEAEFSK